MLIFVGMNAKSFFDIGYLFNLVKILFAGGISVLTMALVKKMIGFDTYTCGAFFNILTAFLSVLAGFAVYIALLFLFRESTINSLKSKKTRCII